MITLSCVSVFAVIVIAADASCRSTAFLVSPVTNSRRFAIKTRILLQSLTETSSDTTHTDSEREQTKGSTRSRQESCTLIGGDEIRPIKVPFVSEYDTSAPAFAAFGVGQARTIQSLTAPPKRKGLEALVPGSFVIENALSAEDCIEMIDTFESLLKLGTQTAASPSTVQMQIVATPKAAQSISQVICPFIDMDSVNSMAASLPGSESDAECDAIGMNRRWKVYRQDDTNDTRMSAPDIDTGVPPCSLSRDGSTLIWNATNHQNQECTDLVDDDSLLFPSDTVSRLTAIIYLNDNFQGGHTEFYDSPSQSSLSDPADLQKRILVASIKPRQGSVLLIPQAVGGHNAIAYARQNWPLYKESPVAQGSGPKYIVKFEILFTTARNGLTEEEKDDPLWRNDELVRSVFLPTSRVLNSYFLSQIKTLYNPQMGVENAGVFLYSFVRFTKVRRVVEIGAGYTTLWLLQALQDNDNELERIGKLKDEGKCRLLDYPWTAESIVTDYLDEKKQSSLLCIDNCLHQRETATGAGAIAKTLGLSHLLQFITGDAFDMKFEPQSIDLLWCDFGVGSRMKDFAAGSWSSVKPGGFLICHSTLTNKATRDWLEAIRSRRGEEETGIPAYEFVELSLLEPHKHYQNSITILQRRRHPEGGDFAEPLYSEYA